MSYGSNATPRPFRPLGARVLYSAIATALKYTRSALFAVVFPVQRLQVPEIIDSALACRDYVIDLPSEVTFDVPILRPVDKSAA